MVFLHFLVVAVRFSTGFRVSAFVGGGPAHRNLSVGTAGNGSADIVGPHQQLDPKSKNKHKPKQNKKNDPKSLNGTDVFLVGHAQRL
jgi:hypothetical protein